MFLGVLGHALKQFPAKVLVRHLAAPEPQGHLYLVSVFQKLEDVAHLHVVVVGVGIGPELDLFDLDDLLLLAGLGLALLRLILEFAEIHDLADRWIGVRGNLDQVQTSLIRHVHGAGGRNNADVFTVGPNQANFRRADIVIDARAGVSGWRRIMGSASDGGRPLVVHINRVHKVLVAGGFFKPLNSAQGGLKNFNSP